MADTVPSPRYRRPTAPRAASSNAVPSMPNYFASRITSPKAHPQTPSPNYFASQADTNIYLDQHAKKNWSPPSSAVRSTAAASPSIVPNDQNPDFDAFRRQSDGKAFSLGGLGGTFKDSSPANLKSKKKASFSSTEDCTTRSRTTSLAEHTPRSPKRVLSDALQERRMSPASFEIDHMDRPQTQPRFDLPLDNTDAYGTSRMARAETVPTSSIAHEEAKIFITPQRLVTLVASQNEDILLLDLRVSTNYTDSHISGALNLCVPTTLLKRASFNVQKLTDTFKDDEQRSKFVKWRNSKYIVVYDAASAQLKDAQTCLNTIKKFESEGYEGNCFIVKGGFTDFFRSFPDYIVDGSSYAGSSNDEGPEVAPVIGGCPMPATDKPANPFFGNIRQNMDLIGGVGQIPLQHPEVSRSSEEEEYPQWLRKAAEQADQGRQVSRKFEQIERREKRRMEDALSGKVSWEALNSPTPKQSALASDNSDNVRIAGIEKGNKNRYNNIWPFEHSRVKLQGVPKNDCDYFNANFIQASYSHKRYISTQAPIPATFNDFWNVIWQQDVRVIVMLTAEKEGAQVKAHNYWNDKHYGNFNLEFLSEKRASLEPERIHNAKEKKKQQRPEVVKRHSTLSPTGALASLDSSLDKRLSTKDQGGKITSSSSEQPYVVVRRFTLSHSKKPFEPLREITQLQYSSWPDFGAPAHPAHLLGLVEQTEAVVRASNKPNSAVRPTPGRRHTGDPAPAGSRPVLVHCSAGCGRTGTFCTVDSVIDMLKRQRLSPGKHSSPMDIDGGFFSSQPEPADSGGPEGKWIDRDDLDLVEKTVEDFRNQRISMVQSLRQFVLCYESIMEWLVEQHKDARRSSVPG